MTEGVLLLGSSDFTIAIADAMVEAGTPPRAVVYAPPEFKISYAPRGVKNVRQADIEAWCALNGVEAIAFESFDQVSQAMNAHRDITLCLLAGWYYMVPKTFRERFSAGCLGFHASLLPKLRGGAPLNWAILQEHTRTGVSLFEVTGGVDEGRLYDVEPIALSEDVYIEDLVAASRLAGAGIVARSLKGILSGALQPQAQTGVPSYGLQRSPEDGRIDWRNSAREIHRLVRAVSRPYPGALTRLGDAEIAIHRADIWRGAQILGVPGQLFTLPGTFQTVVVCGDGHLVLKDAVIEDGRSALELLKQASQQRFGR